MIVIMIQLNHHWLFVAQCIPTDHFGMYIDQISVSFYIYIYYIKLYYIQTVIFTFRVHRDYNCSH